MWCYRREWKSREKYLRRHATGHHLKAAMLRAPPCLWPWHFSGYYEANADWSCLLLPSIIKATKKKKIYTLNNGAGIIQAQPWAGPGMAWMATLIYLSTSPGKHNWCCLPLTRETMQPIFIVLPLHLQALFVRTIETSLGTEWEQKQENGVFHPLHTAVRKAHSPQFNAKSV